MPVGLAVVVVLVELSELLTVDFDLARIIHRQRRLEISLKHIFGRGQDVGDQVLTQHDPIIHRTVDA